MDLIVSHMSAIDFWRKVYPVHRAPQEALPCCRFGELAITDDDVWTKAPQWVTNALLAPEQGILHTLVFSQRERRASKSHRPHVWSGDLPPGSFYVFGDEVYVCSPAFAFLQMAAVLSFPQLLALAYELCGTYSFDDAAERGFRQREVPLVTLEQLRQYVQCACDLGLNGSKLAGAVLRHAIERSASPMETTCAMALVLPPRRGGYALPFPLMNERIPLTGRARALYPKPYCKADLLWERPRLVIEYQGYYDHGGKQEYRADRGRTNALDAMGYKTVELTATQVYNLPALETIALRAAKQVGKRVRKEALGPTPARTQLLEQLRAWNGASGRVARE